MPRLSTGQRIRTGLFIVLGILLISVSLFFIIGENAFRTTNIYFISYEGISVNGLLVGSDVRYNGIAVGTVEDISFAENNIEEVVVTISVEADTPIKLDTQARLVPVGITGTRQIELFGGTNAAAASVPRSFIPAGTGTLERFTLPAENIANDLQVVLGQLSTILAETDFDRVDNIIRGVERIVLSSEPLIANVLNNVDKIVTAGQGPIQNVITQIDQTGKNLAAASASLESVALSLSDADFADDVEGLFDELSLVLVNTQEAVTIAVDSIQDVQGIVATGGGEVERSLRLLRETLQYLNNFAMPISQDPSAVLR